MIRQHNEKIEKAAIYTIANALEALRVDEHIENAVGHLIVMDFTQTDPGDIWDGSIESAVTEDDTFGDLFGEFILTDHRFGGDTVHYRDEFRHNARAKALLSGRMQMPTGMALASAPFRIRQGDGSYQGGTYFDGVVIGFSGIPAEYDEAMADIYLALLFACAQRGLLEARQKRNFID
jgi:hypothetical protein